MPLTARPTRMLPRAELLFPAEAEQTMGMPATGGRWTATEVREMQDESRPWPRYEFIDGQLLVSPGPRPDHQWAVAELFAPIRAYVARENLGVALLSPADLELEPETVVQPDIFVVPLVHGKRPRAWNQIPTLLLACEVLSPSTARYDRVTKRRFFSRVGVAEYWIVDLDARLVERSRPDDDRVEIATTELRWHPAGARASLVLSLTEFFAELTEG
jgi:Uma2 family endonuclease